MGPFTTGTAANGPAAGNACTVDCGCDREIFILQYDDQLKDNLGVSLPDYAFLLKDLNSARGVARSIGLGAAYISHYRGKAYLILKGYPGERLLKGTRYLAQNAKVAHISGVLGDSLLTAKNVLRGPGLAVITTVGWEIAKEVLRDPCPGEDPKWGGVFYRGLAVETMKAAIVGTLGWGAGVLVASIVGAPVVASILVGAAVGFGAMLLLDWLDSRSETMQNYRKLGTALGRRIDKERETWPRLPDGSFAPRFGVDYPLASPRTAFG